MGRWSQLLGQHWRAGHRLPGREAAPRVRMQEDV